MRYRGGGGEWKKWGDGEQSVLAEVILIVIKQEENLHTHTHTDTAWMRIVCATADQVVWAPTDASRDAEEEDEVRKSLLCS